MSVVQEELSKYIVKARYARHNKAARRRETFAEANDRVRNMMKKRFPGLGDTIDWAYDMVAQGRVLGSQRNLQFGGVPVERKEERSYNCWSSYCDRVRFFQEALYLLLCGGGVGFSVQKHHVGRLPGFATHRLSGGPRPSSVFDVPDTIEGWGDALGILISSYLGGGLFPEYEGTDVEFRFHLIRPEGSALSSGAGRAPGPEPLRKALEKVRALLERCLAGGQDRLRPIDAYDIVMHASDAVLAGGVRRSATICIFSADDAEMMAAKTGDWFTENPQRARSNNSALLLRGSTTREQFHALMEAVKGWGEPGFLWADSTEFASNPCFAPETLIATESGLRRIGDMAASGKEFRVASDVRVGKGDVLDSGRRGVALHDATPAVLTQRQAELFEVVTEYGHRLKVTSAHEFPTTRGRLQLRDMVVGDTILLPSGEGAFGEGGTYEEGCELGTVDHHEVPKGVLEGGREFVRGFLATFRPSRPSTKLLCDLQAVFAQFGVVTKVTDDGLAFSPEAQDTFLVRVESIVSSGVSDVFCLTQFDTNAVIANGCVTGQCLEIGMWPRLALGDLDTNVRELVLAEHTGPLYEDGSVSGWQSCVSGDTRLITRSGIVNIADAVGHETAIWNGKRWSITTPFVTGHDRELYRVTFSDGSFLDATAEHRFLVKDRTMEEFREVKTADLLAYSKYPLSVPRANVSYEDCGGRHEEYAYEYGFILADGTTRHGHSPFAELFGPKMRLPLRGSRSEVRRVDGYAVDSQYITFTGVDNAFAVELKEGGIPSEVFGWDYDSIINFISGWADGDGSQANLGCRIYGNEARMRDLQLLLTKVGMVGSVNLMSKAGESTNFGVRKNDVWYVQIPNATRLRCHRLRLEGGQDAKFKGKYQVVRSIEKLPGTHTTYCLTEPELHQCVFNNVLTLQCNLTTVNGGLIETEHDFYEACGAAAFIGTLQASFTSFPYLGLVSELIARREALLGVSVTRFMSNPSVLLSPAVLRRGAHHVLEVNAEYAAKIGIKPCARATCGKPEGTSTLVLKGLDSGCHQWPFEKGIRHVQENKGNPVLRHFAASNPLAVEHSVWSANDTDDVIAFPMEAPAGAIVKGHYDAVGFLDVVKLLQTHWVTPGRRISACTQPWLNHNISNTVSVNPDEWDAVEAHIYDNREHYCGVSLLGASGDKDYRQAPHVAVYSVSEQEARYGAEAVRVAWIARETGEALYGHHWDACDALLGVKADLTPEQSAWCWSVRQEVGLFESLKELTYAIKDGANWDRYVALRDSFVPVDYDLLIEEEDATVPTAEASCAGGACQI